LEEDFLKAIWKRADEIHENWLNEIR
jgi:hypothetical protein